MLYTITLLTAFSFAVLYPFVFWINADDPLKNNFHRFHLGLPTLIGGVIVVYILLTPWHFQFKFFACIWILLLAGVTYFYWHKEYPHSLAITVPSLFGLYLYMSLFNFLYSRATWAMILISILGGLILWICLYAMNLGHWYLNVHGLPLKHLKRAIDIFWGLLAVRLAIDIYLLIKGEILYHSYSISYYQFLGKMEGMLLCIALLFGTLLPLVCLYFVKETIRLKNTQSATGILYVILCAVLVGDITYKYYLFRYGLAL